MTSDQSHESLLEKLLRLKNQSNEDIEKIKKWKQEISYQKERAIDDIFDKFDEFKTTLDAKRDEICKQFRTTYDQKLAEFDETVSMLEQQLKEIDQLNFTDQGPVLPQREVQLSIDYAPVINAIEQLTPTSKQPTAKVKPLLVPHLIKIEPLTQLSETSPAAPSSTSKNYHPSPPQKRFCPESGNKGPVQSTPDATGYIKTIATRTTDGAAAKTSAMKKARNVQHIIRCKKCNKPRCVYSKQPISTDITNHLKTWSFKCGKHIPRWNRHCKELTIDSGDCSTDVSIAYFFSEGTQVCYKCGSPGELQECLSDEMQNFSYYHPVCRACVLKGIKPRTRKKYESRKTDNKKTESDSYNFQMNTKFWTL